MLDPGPLPANGYRRIVPDRVMDPTGHDLSSDHGRHHHPKQRETRSEILGAVYRIDQEGTIRRPMPRQRLRLWRRLLRSAKKVPIGSLRYGKRLKSGEVVPCQVEVFPLEVKSQRKRWLEKGQRLTVVDPAEAADEPERKHVIRRAESLLTTSGTA